MSIPTDEVPEAAIDYEEVFRRGGANCGDEDFALCKCPFCRTLFLVEYEADTIYTSATDLTIRQPINLGVSSFECTNCRIVWPRGIWIGPDAPATMRVKWSDLAESPWSWISRETRINPTG